MFRKILLLLFALTLTLAIVLISMENASNSSGSFSTNNMKKFSDGVKSRDSNTMSDSDIKKALKSIFPNMKVN
ncbi:MAG: hypothetical protein HGA22_04850 [Clostridiales bacterium]|nr:hypothetical protein [Clostridiales bacterium]